MGKSKKKFKMEDEERQERILDQMKLTGRMPTPPPGHFHDTGEKQRRRKDRKNERNRLRDMTKEFNNGE